MKGKIKITQSAIDRIKQSNTNNCGALFGSFNKTTQYILGLFSNDQYNNADLLFPAEIDLCGAYQVGPIKKEEVNKILKDVEVTDNPIFLSIPNQNTVDAYYVINNKLENASLSILSEEEIYSEFIHIRLQAPLTLLSEITIESISEELLLLRRGFSSGKSAFHFEDYDLFILAGNENIIVGPDDVTEETMVQKLCSLINTKKREEEEQQYNKNKNDLVILSVSMFRKATIDKGDVNGPNNHAPVIQIEKNETKMVNLVFNLDAMSLVHKETNLNKLYTILVESACRNLKLVGNFIMDSIEDCENKFPITFLPLILHFYPSKCGHFVTRVVNKNEADKENLRKLLHTNLLLPTTRPMFRIGNQYKFKNPDTRIMNPHKALKDITEGGEQALVQGNYYYYHYKQDEMDDDGWGCAYRSLQTLASWLRLQGYTDKAVPTFKDIQKCLYDIGDKPANFVGSRQWIGSTEVNFVLESLLGTSCKIIFVNSGDELSTKGPDLVHHFTHFGSPIMIGGGVLAHTILGVNYNRDTGDIKFLILDPHYTGKDDIKTIISKGWCGWKGMNFWDKKAYYNMCLPLVPKCI